LNLSEVVHRKEPSHLRIRLKQRLTVQLAHGLVCDDDK
jgi:hypothetical protein